MKSLPPKIQLLPILVVTDASLHSTIWNPPHCSTSDKAAGNIFDLMGNWDLRMCSPAGEPTFGVNSSTTKGTTIDLVWVNKQLDEIIKACFVDVDNMTNHLSDHQALTTAFINRNPDPEKNTGSTPRKINWHKAKTTDLLTELLQTLPTSASLETQEDFDIFDPDLRGAIVNTLNNTSPNKAPPGKHKH